MQTKPTVADLQTTLTPECLMQNKINLFFSSALLYVPFKSLYSIRNPTLYFTFKIPIKTKLRLRNRKKQFKVYVFEFEKSENLLIDFLHEIKGSLHFLIIFLFIFILFVAHSESSYLRATSIR